MPQRKKSSSKRGRPVKNTQEHVFASPSVKKRILTSWKWGESYTSLLLGVVVVIVGVLFGVTLVKQHKNLQDTSSIQTGPTAIVSPTPSSAQVKDGQKVYRVVEGDSLWSIAEKFYKSGYNWIDIAQANNLSDPDTIHGGNELVIPSIAPKEQTVSSTPLAQVASAQSITGSTYTIQKDDDLWDIAVRAYGDGYRWVDLAKENNLSNPDLLFVGNKLTIPR